MKQICEYIQKSNQIYLVALRAEHLREIETPNLPIQLRKNNFCLEHLGLFLLPTIRTFFSDNDIKLHDQINSHYLFMLYIHKHMYKMFQNSHVAVILN